jgi:hypothetical protein
MHSKIWPRPARAKRGTLVSGDYAPETVGEPEAFLGSWARAKSWFCSHEGKLKIHNPTTPPPNTYAGLCTNRAIYSHALSHRQYTIWPIFRWTMAW